MVAKRHAGYVTGGKFKPDDAASFTKVFYGHEGKRVTVTVERERKHRSNNQNAYMWGVVYNLIAEHTGYTHDEVHDAMRWLFLRVRRDGLPDTTKSTASLSTTEMEIYLKSIRRWAAVELSVYIPLPNECDYNDN
jgi:hypothetical protein